MPNYLSFSCVFFLFILSLFFTSWIRIQATNGMRIQVDPDPKHCSPVDYDRWAGSLTEILIGSGRSSLADRKEPCWRTSRTCWWLASRPIAAPNGETICEAFLCNYLSSHLLYFPGPCCELFVSGVWFPRMVSTRMAGPRHITADPAPSNKINSAPGAPAHQRCLYNP
jgi:hypothetical protein